MEIKIGTAILTAFIWLEPASALNLSVQPRFKSGIQYYEYERESFQSVVQGSQGQFIESLGKAKIRNWLPFVSGGATVFIDRFFVDFNVQHSFDGKDSSDFNNQDFVAGGNSLPTDTIGRTSNTINANFDRLEWAISVGFEVYENLVLFAGYKQSSTDFKTNIDGNFNSFQASDMTPIPFLTGSYTGELDLELEYDGPFVGTSYNWRIQQGFMDGALSFNFAAAFLDGTVDLNFRNVVANTVSGGTSFDFQSLSENQWKDVKGDSIGLSFGVAWRGLTPVSGLTYSMGVAGYRYEFDSNNSSDFNETQVRMDFGLAYAFDI
jgi:hypothetical protein